MNKITYKLKNVLNLAYSYSLFYRAKIEKTHIVIGDSVKKIVEGVKYVQDDIHPIYLRQISQNKIEVSEKKSPLNLLSFFVHGCVCYLLALKSSHRFSSLTLIILCFNANLLQKENSNGVISLSACYKKFRFYAKSRRRVTTQRGNTKKKLLLCVNGTLK